MPSKETNSPNNANRDTGFQGKTEKDTPDKAGKHVSVYSCGVAVVDLHKNVVKVNAQLRQWLNLNQQQGSVSCHRYLWEKERPCPQCPLSQAEAISTESVSLIHEHHSPTGRTRSYRVIVVPLPPLQSGPDHILEVVQDITETRKIERQIQQSDKMATVGELASGLAHEIGTPLTVIQGTAEYLMADLYRDDPKYQEFEIILSQTSRITALIEHLLNFSRYSNPEMRPLDVNELILKVLTLMDHQINKYNCFVKTVFEPGLPRISGDQNQLEQAFLNVVVNALQSMQDKGTLTITTRRLSNGGKWIAIRFADTGCGISETNIRRIFDPFFTTKSVGKCTGLGLTVSHRIVEDHNGTLEVESSLGKGSTFTIKLPYDDDGTSSSQ